MFKVLIFFAFLIKISYNQRITIERQSSLQAFKNYPLIKGKDNQFSICSFIKSNIYIDNEIFSYFIRQSFCPSIIVNSNFENPQFVMKSTENFIFVDGIQTIVEISERMQNFSFWSSSTNNHYLILASINNTDFLNNILVTIWKKNIINFVLVFVYKSLHIVSYNPFKKQKTYITKFDRQYFPDKIKKLYGFKFKVSIWEDWPLLKKENSGWRGQQFGTLKIIADMINATVEFIETSYEQGYEGVLTSLAYRKSDFSINVFFQRSLKELDSSYPHTRLDYVVLIPFDKNQFTSRSLILVFHPIVWALFGIDLLLVSSFLTLSNSFFTTLATFIGTSIPLFNSKTLSKKCILMIFIYTSMVIQTAFQCFVIKSYIAPPLDKKIETLSDLARSGIKIRVYPILMDLIRKDRIEKQFIPAGKLKINKYLRRQDTTTAYLVDILKAEEIVNMWKNNKENSPFYILHQVLLPGIGVYRFQKHSPFVEKIDQCIGKIKQHGLDKNTQVSKPAIKNENSNVALKLQHFKEVFIFLVCGLTSALSIFIVELLIFSMNEKM